MLWIPIWKWPSNVCCVGDLCRKKLLYCWSVLFHFQNGNVTRLQCCLIQESIRGIQSLSQTISCTAQFNTHPRVKQGLNYIYTVANACLAKKIVCFFLCMILIIKYSAELLILGWRSERREGLSLKSLQAVNQPAEFWVMATVIKWTRVGNSWTVSWGKNGWAQGK